MCRKGIWNSEGEIEVDNEAIKYIKYMSHIIITCIVLHNLCTINNECIEDDWIVEAKIKLARKITNGELRKKNEL